MTTSTYPGTVVSETADAYLFDDGDSKTWLPKSQCEWDPDAREMTVPDWLATKEGLA